MVSDTTVLRIIAGTVAGVGAVYLCSIGKLDPAAAAAILSGLIAFFTGEANGRRTAQT